MRIPVILYDYIIRVFFSSFSIVFGALSALIILFDTIDLLRKSAHKINISESVILKMLCLKLPLHLQEILPFVILFTAILTFWRLNRYSEVIVMRAAGLSIWQLLKPLTLVALLIGFTDLILISPFSAKMMGRFTFYENYYFKSAKGTIELSETGIWLREKVGAEHRIYNVSSIDNANQTLNSSIVYCFSEINKFLKRIDVHKINLISMSKTSQTKKKSSVLVFDYGWETYPESPPKRFKKLVLPTSLSLTTIYESITNPRILPFWQLPYYAELLERSGLTGRQYMVRFHTLLARAFWLAAMILLAATFSLRFIRSHQTGRIIILGLMSALGFYFLREVVSSLGNVGTIPGALGAWIPVSLVALCAITKLLYSEDG